MFSPVESDWFVFPRWADLNAATVIHTTMQSQTTSGAVSLWCKHDLTKL